MTQIGRYEILEEIGRGGFATVYKARDTRLKRTVALKILHSGWSGDPDFVRRFQQEAETIANLRHPNIVVIHDVGEADRQLYLAMEYLPGDDLQEWLTQNEAPLTVAETVTILRPIASALDYAHKRGIIHRDIKPSNIMRDDSTLPARLVLTDFGLVKAMENSVALTMTSQMLGSPEYMAPEQADPNRADEIGPAADLYAFGIVAYQMMAGRVPFPGHSISTLYAHANLPVPEPQELNPDLTDKETAVLNRMLAKTPADRYSTALAFVEALQATSQMTPEEQVIPLYAQLQQAEADGEWVQVLTLATQIELLLSGYKDVAARKAEASRHLQTPKTPTESRAAAVELPIVETDSAPETPAQPGVVVPQKRVSTAKAASPAKKQGVPAYVWLVGGFVGVLIIAFLIWRVTAGSQSPEPVTEATVAVTADATFPPSNPVLGSSWVRPADEMVMVYVPGGSFMMGSDPDVDEYASDNEQPHEVMLDGFWIDQTEVTNAKYAGCIENGKCESSLYFGDASFNGENQPVVGVTWYDAEAYCEWVGGQLPTEAQWEYAARGVDGRIYPWGNEFDGEKANFCDVNCEFDHKDVDFDDSFARTAPVGSYPDGASWVGALDMAGNVWEWVRDWYDSDYYASSPANNPQRPDSGQYKVLRGGGWDYNDYYIRAAYRSSYDPAGSNFNAGLRCAQE